MKQFISNVKSEYDILNQLTLEEQVLKIEKLKGQIHKSKLSSNFLAPWFAAVQIVSERTLGLKHYDTQLLAGYTLHDGKIAEMKTGEGKTLASTLAVSFNALSQKGVHVVTVNDYLAERDQRWMGKVYRG